MTDAFYDCYDSDALRIHIHTMLDDYMQEHLLIDHQHFTHFAVWQILQSLETVSMTEPYSYRLPVDPLDLIPKIYASIVDKPYDEKLQISQAVAAYFKASLTFGKSVNTMERVLAHPGSDLAPQMERFEMTALTNYSRGRTVMPGSGRILEEKISNSSLTKMKSVSKEELEDMDIDEDKLINVSWRLRKEQHTEITSLLKTIPGANSAPSRLPTVKNIVLSQLSRPESPLLSSAFIDNDNCMPITARSKPYQRSTKLSSRTDLPPAEKPYSDGPLELEVDGWRTYQTSSPVVSSGYGSLEDEVDELDLSPQTPDTEPFQIEDPKMEVPLIPRVRRAASGGGENVPLPGTNQSLHAFFQQEKIYGYMDGEHDADDFSLLGIDGSAVGIPEDGDLDQQLRHLYSENSPTALKDLIMKEVLDEKHVFYMDVPEVPPPNVHPPFQHLHLPDLLSDLPVQSSSRKKGQGKTDNRFLKHVKGLSLLNVELSWSPFTAPQLPSHMDVADTMTTPDIDAVMGLLVTVMLVDEPKNIFDLALRGLADEDTISMHGDFYQCQPVMSRQELRRLLTSRAVSANERNKENTRYHQTSMPIHKRPRLHSPSEDSELHQAPDQDDDNADREFLEFASGEDHFMADDVAQNIVSAPDSLVDEGGPPIDVQQDFDIPLVANETRHKTAMFETADPLFTRDSRKEISSVFNSSHDAFDFVALRAKTIESRETRISDEIPQALPQPTEAPAAILVPTEIIDNATLQLSLAEWSPPTSQHYYLANINIFPKHHLIGCLASAGLGYIELVEREYLSGVDLVIDPHNAVILVTWFKLDTEWENVVQLVEEQSWRYSKILLLFESYAGNSSITPFSPLTVKATKRLRRTLVMAEATGAMSAGCQIETAFPLSVQEAAIYVRAFGDRAEDEDTTDGMLWVERDQWLLADVTEEDDHNLASAYGMNCFASILILCQISLLELLGMDSDERAQRFGPFVGEARMLQLNDVIDQRMRELTLDKDELASNSAGDNHHGL